MSLQDLNFFTIFKIIVRHLPLIILLAAIGGGIGYHQGVYNTRPTYTSSGIVMVQNYNDTAENYANSRSTVGITTPSGISGNVANNLNMSARLAEECLILFQVDPEFGKLTAGAFVTPTIIDESRFIRISVTSGNNAKTKEICNNILTYARKLFVDSFPEGDLKIIQPASTPAYSGGSNTRSKMQMYAIIGIAIALLLSFLHEFIDSTIKPDEDLSAKYNVPVLAEILNLDATGKKKK
jgi:capsular polysaccharide biosynthesis protein